MLDITNRIQDALNNICKCSALMTEYSKDCNDIDKLSAYQLLRLYNLVKRCLSIYNEQSFLYANNLKDYYERVNTYQFLMDNLVFPKSNCPKIFVTENNEAISLNNSPQVLMAMINIFDDKLIDNEEILEVANEEKINEAITNINNLSENCLKTILGQIKKMESLESIDFEGDFVHDLANSAILQAFKKNDPRECIYLPSDVVAEIVKILQKDLDMNDTADITNLYSIAKDRLEQIISYDSNYSKKLIK